jgi:hypothetical protein
MNRVSAQVGYLYRLFLLEHAVTECANSNTEGTSPVLRELAVPVTAKMYHHLKIHPQAGSWIRPVTLADQHAAQEQHRKASCSTVQSRMCCKWHLVVEMLPAASLTAHEAE